MSELTQVIPMIACGYEQLNVPLGSEDWEFAMALLRELLIPECRGHYTRAHDGYSIYNYTAWTTLYKVYEDECRMPWADLLEELGRMLDRADKWSNHLAHKVEEGDEYRRTEDPWYNSKFEKGLEVNDPHRQKGIDLRSAQFDDERHPHLVRLRKR